MTMQKLIAIGNVGNDPEIKQFQDGGSVANLSLACSERWNDKQGNRQEHTEWLRVSFSGGLANVVAQYVRKGSKIYIEGKLRTRKWTDNQGVERQITEVRADQMQMLDSKGDNGQQPNVSYPKTPQGQQYAQNAMANAPQPNYQQQPFNNNMQGNMPQAGYADTSDVPF